MGIVLWYSPLPSSQFHSNFNDLVSSISTLIPNNKLNIQFNEFEHDNHSRKSSSSSNGNSNNINSSRTFNRYGFNILPPHITLIKNIPNDVEIFNKIIKIITTTLHTEEKNKKENEILIKDIKFNNNNKFFENCILEVDKNSIYILLSLITIITDIVEGVPKQSNDPLIFNPHVSLSYSDCKFSTQLDKDMIIDRVNTYLKINLLQNKELNSVDWFVRMNSVNSRKKSGRFYIVNCEGYIDKWSVLRSIVF